MVKRKQIVLILLSLMCGMCYGQCNFKVFVDTYFDVYHESDTLVNMEIYGTGGHEWQLKGPNNYNDCAVKYFPSSNWFSACAYHIKKCIVLRFWDEKYTDTALINNTMLLLCNEEGEIIDKIILENTNIEYSDISRNSVWSQYYSLKNKIIWRLYKETEDGEYIEKQFRIDKNRIVPL